MIGDNANTHTVEPGESCNEVWSKIFFGFQEIAIINNFQDNILHVIGFIVALRDVVALSTGSACSSGAMESSYVIKALGADDEDAQGSLRFGLGRGNTGSDVDLVVERLIHAVDRLRALSPRFEAVTSGREPGMASP